MAGRRGQRRAQRHDGPLRSGALYRVYAPPLLRLAAGALFFFLARRNRPAGAVLLAVGGFCLAVDLAAVVLNRLSIDFWDAPAPFSWILFDENTLSLFSGVFFLGLGAVRAKRA